MSRSLRSVLPLSSLPATFPCPSSAASLLLRPRSSSSSKTTAMKKEGKGLRETGLHRGLLCLPRAPAISQGCSAHFRPRRHSPSPVARPSSRESMRAESGTSAARDELFLETERPLRSPSSPFLQPLPTGPHPLRPPSPASLVAGGTLPHHLLSRCGSAFAKRSGSETLHRRPSEGVSQSQRVAFLGISQLQTISSLSEVMRCK